MSSNQEAKDAASRIRKSSDKVKWNSTGITKKQELLAGLKRHAIGIHCGLLVQAAAILRYSKKNRSQQLSWSWDFEYGRSDCLEVDDKCSPKVL